MHVAWHPPLLPASPAPLARASSTWRGWSPGWVISSPTPAGLLASGSRTQGSDVDKPLKTLQVSISRWEQLAGTLVFQGSERNKNRWGTGKVIISFLLSFQQSSSQCVILSLGSRELLAVGAPVWCHVQIVEVVEGAGSHLDRRRTGGGSRSWESYLREVEKTLSTGLEASVGNFPPALQESLRGTRACLFSFIHSLIHSLTHSFVHSLTHSLTHSFIIRGSINAAVK